MVGYEKCVLVGHDWGGAVSWSYAAIHPERVHRLIVMNCPHMIAYKNHASSSLSQIRKSWYVSVCLCVSVLLFTYLISSFFSVDAMETYAFNMMKQSFCLRLLFLLHIKHAWQISFWFILRFESCSSTLSAL